MKETDSSSKFALLGMLSICPGSGYDIRKMVQASIGYFWNESYGRIYPLLKELVREELIRPERRQPESGRARQSYAITKKGLQALELWLKKTPRVEPNRSELLLKIFFSNLMPAVVTSEHVLERKQLEERNLSSYDRVEESLRKNHAGKPALPYWLSTLSYGRHRSRAIVAWCNETLENLSEIPQERGKK
jgi:PadR family transcriptional regulator AphA